MPRNNSSARRTERRQVAIDSMKLNERILRGQGYGELADQIYQRRVKVEAIQDRNVVSYA